MQSLIKRYQQAHKEARWTLALAVFYFIWWYASAYGLAPQNDALPELYAGLPLWFLMACVIGPIIFSALCIIMIRTKFKSMSLAPDDAEASHNE